jgi:hypothetical protein
MLAGQLYRASDPEIQADQESAKAWMARATTRDVPRGAMALGNPARVRA